MVILTLHTRKLRHGEVSFAQDHTAGERQRQTEFKAGSLLFALNLGPPPSNDWRRAAWVAALAVTHCASLCLSFPISKVRAGSGSIVLRRILTLSLDPHWFGLASPSPCVLGTLVHGEAHTCQHLPGPGAGPLVPLQTWQFLVIARGLVWLLFWGMNSLKTETCHLQ